MAQDLVEYEAGCGGRNLLGENQIEKMPASRSAISVVASCAGQVDGNERGSGHDDPLLQGHPDVQQPAPVRRQVLKITIFYAQIYLIPTGMS
jgi:hypothetical protein